MNLKGNSNRHNTTQKPWVEWCGPRPVCLARGPLAWGSTDRLSLKCWSHCQAHGSACLAAATVRVQ